MDRSKKLFIFVILILIIASLAAIGAGSQLYIPVIRSSNLPYIIDPCYSGPYPQPTAIDCPNPYPAPDTPKPKPTQTPWIITATPPTLDHFIYLPVIESGTE